MAQAPSTALLLTTRQHPQRPQPLLLSMVFHPYPNRKLQTLLRQP